MFACSPVSFGWLSGPAHAAAAVGTDPALCLEGSQPHHLELLWIRGGIWPGSGRAVAGGGGGGGQGGAGDGGRGLETGRERRCNGRTRLTAAQSGDLTLGGAGRLGVVRPRRPLR